ncbi:uncharacterized protein LOC120762349 isoform X2 [Hirundo rustica]|uniref:uncharacterized protein LOC120762349 isoform X2 n=2 Tax=Hirundo rustica TaxID=43150 RepID=UPI001A941634|nr:uncharacterized protein LOC120762349 isoform X2 [Hirundo rustica]XP_039940664.2 uncharacterized protein LOC120762349 isoform X2 [Hirundo rustica]
MKSSSTKNTPRALGIVSAAAEVSREKKTLLLLGWNGICALNSIPDSSAISNNHRRGLTGSSVDTYGSHMAPLGNSSTKNTGNRQGADGREGAPVLTAQPSLPSLGNKSWDVGRNIFGRTRGVLRDAAGFWSPSHQGEETRISRFVSKAGGAGREVPQGGRRDSADKRCLCSHPTAARWEHLQELLQHPPPGSVSPLAGGVGSAAKPWEPGWSQAVPKAQDRDTFLLSRHRRGDPGSPKGCEDKSKAVWAFRGDSSRSFSRTEGVQGKEGAAQAGSGAHRDLGLSRASQAALESRMGSFKGNTHSNRGRRAAAAPQPNPHSAHLPREDPSVGWRGNAEADTSRVPTALLPGIRSSGASPAGDSPAFHRLVPFPPRSPQPLPARIRGAEPRQRLRPRPLLLSHRGMPPNAHTAASRAPAASRHVPASGICSPAPLARPCLWNLLSSPSGTSQVLESSPVLLAHPWNLVFSSPGTSLPLESALQLP